MLHFLGTPITLHEDDTAGLYGSLRACTIRFIAESSGG